MGRVLTNNVALAVAVEATPGVLPGSPVWMSLEPNDITKFGAEVKTTARKPISKLRQNRKGAVTDLDSGVEFEHDLTREIALTFLEGFVFATFAGPAYLTSGGNALVANDDVAGAGLNGFEHAAQAAALANNVIIWTRGFTAAIDNGQFIVDGPNSTTTVTAVQGTPGIVDETPTAVQNATLAVAGRRGATSDITWTAATKTLGSTALNLTTLGLSVGQLIHVGGRTSTNQFAGGVTYGRIRSIAAGAIVLDKLKGTLVANDSGTGKQIDILFGRFLKNVAVDSASFLERSYQFEAAYQNLDNPGPGAKYEYSIGNMADQIELQLPLTDKAKITFSFIGRDTEVPTVTRKTNAANPWSPVQTAAYSTATDIASLRILRVDETELSSCFKDTTLTLANNVSAEKCLGTLGASFMNEGNFDVNLKAQLLFTDSRLVDAIRNNETLTFDTLLKNGDGGLAFDIPSMTLGDGSKDFPVNESVLINLTGEAFVDASLGTSIGISFFPVLP